MIRRHFILPALALTLASPGPLTAAPDPSYQCDQAAARASELNGVPIDILLAISRVETGRGGSASGPWPWTINADGQGQWYDSKADAVLAATDHLTDGTGTFDVGCFQLNFRWHGENFPDLGTMFDPVANADYAASYLAGLYQEFGDWSQAVSAYHSRTAELAEAYLQKVKSVLADPGASPVAPEPENEVRENLFPLLQAGGQGSAGSIVPLQLARGRLIGGNP